MALRGGNILHVGNGTTIIDRIQSAGPGDLNVPEEKIYELGNYESVATIRDVPDINFSLESFDVSCEIEALLTGKPLATTNEFDLTTVRAIDITAPIKAGKNSATPFTVVNSVGLPTLMPESISYRFGLRDNARQTISLRGDAIFYCPGGARVETFVGDNTDDQVLELAQTAGLYQGGSGLTRILSVTVGNSRLTKGPDYEVSGGTSADFEKVNVTMKNRVAVGEQIRVMYFSDAELSYPQSVHEGVTVKPAAVRGKDIDVYVGGKNPEHKWTGIQSVTLDWRAELTKDEEFGSYYAVSNEFDVPTADGQIEVQFRDPEDMMRRLRQITGVTNEKRAIGPDMSAPMEMHIVLKDGSKGGEIVKVLSVEQARFTVPGYTGRANEKMTQTISWSDDKGKVIAKKAL